MAKKYNMTEEDVKSSLGGIDAILYDMKVRKAIELMKETKEKIHLQKHLKLTKYCTI